MQQNVFDTIMDKKRSFSRNSNAMFHYLLAYDRDRKLSWVIVFGVGENSHSWPAATPPTSKRKEITKAAIHEDPNNNCTLNRPTNRGGTWNSNQPSTCGNSEILSHEGNESFRAINSSSVRQMDNRWQQLK